MKRRASQELCSEAKRVDDDESLSSSEWDLQSDECVLHEPKEVIADSDTLERYFPYPDQGTVHSDDTTQTSAVERYFPCPDDGTFHSDDTTHTSDLDDYILSRQAYLPQELPVFQLQRRSLVAIRNLGVTYFSLLASDVFSLVLAALYGLADLRTPLGTVDEYDPPDVSIQLLEKITYRAEVDVIGDDCYRITTYKATQQTVSFSDSTCKRAQTYETLGDAHTFPSNCKTKEYCIVLDTFTLSKNESVDEEPTSSQDNVIAKCVLEYNFEYVVVFSSNCVALIGYMDAGSNHRIADLTVLYFLPDFTLYAKQRLRDCEICRAASVDRDDNLYLLVDDYIEIYSCDDGEFNYTESICARGAFGFCLTPNGDLLLAREACVDLYKKQ